QRPGHGRARSDALAPRHARQLCGHEFESDVNQPAGRDLQACHRARLFHGPPGVCGQTCASRSAGGGDDRVRADAHSSSGNLPPLVHQGSRRACATRRKDSSGRSRIIQSDLGIGGCRTFDTTKYGATAMIGKLEGKVAVKAGVEGLVHVLANELRGRNITVNAVAPGQVQTVLFLKGKSDARIDELKKMNPLERLGMPEDMANVVSFLAGPDGGWINSQVVRPNGGFAY